tara:strand:- start:1884 stop:2321 length:438 start_codon:yes stop_codon:yes gene_type:complete
MQETKVTLIYWGLSLFIFFAVIPWILNPVLAIKSIQALAIYGGIIVAFLGGIIWGWKVENASSKNLWIAIGFSILGLSVALITFLSLTASLVLLIISLHAYLRFEKINSEYFQLNTKYANARNLITNLVTICCITSIAFLNNPYT